jgi:hypothetical protein
MSDINVQIKQRNSGNTGWDNIFPVTKAIITQKNGGGSVQDHIDDADIHVTITDKNKWDEKQNALGFIPENIANKGIANGYASLGADGKIIQSQLPSIAITDVFVVGSQSEQLVIPVQTGDVCIRTDEDKSYINKTGNNTAMSDWEVLRSPNNTTITSVNGQIGEVTLTYSDVGASPQIHQHTKSQITDFPSNATQSTSGLMSPVDKTKLDGIQTNANNYVHPNDDGNLHIPATGTTSNGKVLKAGSTPGNVSWQTLVATDVGAAPSSHIGSTGTSHGVSTTSTAGFMSATDKAKLDGVSSSANKVESSTTNGNIKIDTVETKVYTHPSSHSPSIITQDSNNMFVSDSEKTTWNAKQNAIQVSSSEPTGISAGDLFFLVV